MHEAALALDPKFEETLTNMGQAWKEYGEQLKADKCFSDAIALQPRSIVAWWLRGSTRLLAGRHTIAINDLKMCSNLKPDFFDARVTLAVALQGRGRFRDAVEEADAILKIKPENVVWFNRRLAILTQRSLSMPLAAFSFDRLLEDIVKVRLVCVFIV
jgi:tetratricopeptide (TPR) repeat protein